MTSNAFIFDATVSMHALTWLSLKAGTGNRGTERGTERGTRKTGTRKAGIFKNRNEKSRNL